MIRVVYSKWQFFQSTVFWSLKLGIFVEVGANQVGKWILMPTDIFLNTLKINEEDFDVCEEDADETSGQQKGMIHLRTWSTQRHCSKNKIIRARKP